jgi:hypothetical protein
VITSLKNDLIVDVTKYKGAWIVKAIFIVPPDPLAQKLLAVPQATDKAEDAKPDEPSVTK